MDYESRRKWLAGISLAVVLLLMVALTLFVSHWLRSFSQEDFREYIRSFGAASWLVMLGLQILQVFIALIPGEDNIHCALLNTGGNYRIQVTYSDGTSETHMLVFDDSQVCRLTIYAPDSE